MNFSIELDSFGNLTLIDQEGATHRHVRAVRAFPITDPQGGVSLMDEHGKELAWIDDVNSLPEEGRGLLLEQLSLTEFMPEILRIERVSTFATPSIWSLVTSHGKTKLKLKGEDDIRRITKETLLITDANGIQFLIRDFHALDKPSRKILDRFL
jgi:hypothetical protein